MIEFAASAVPDGGCRSRCALPWVIGRSRLWCQSRRNKWPPIS